MSPPPGPPPPPSPQEVPLSPSLLAGSHHLLQQEQRTGVNAEEFHSLGRQLHSVTERIEVRTNPGPPSADRDMTFEEKRKLSVFVGALDGDKLDRVIEIITQEQPELPGKGLCDCVFVLSCWSSLPLSAHSCQRTGAPSKVLGQFDVYSFGLLRDAI